tara:strand:+ start:300 stop:1022 length:723 start_codon:yes stop_codon:yes gene_type:complete
MIFNLFNIKPTLKELIPSGYVDIHSHILPGIDDGSKNVSESISLITKMKEIGFSKIIGTPHSYPGLYDNTTDSIKKSFKELKKDLKININIDYASEYMLDNTIIEKAKNKDLLCLKDNYLLIEMSYLSAPINLYEIIFELNVNGYKPILAHPERYHFFSMKDFFKLKKAGCYFQLNLLSTLGHYGKRTLKMTNKLFDKNLFDFVGSDVHKINHLLLFDKKVEIQRTKKLVKCIENNKLFD